MWTLQILVQVKTHDSKHVTHLKSSQDNAVQRVHPPNLVKLEAHDGKYVIFISLCWNKTVRK